MTMAEDVVQKAESSNSCCKVWKDKYINLEKKRNALREAVKLLEQEINKIQAENLNLKKGYDEERDRASIEREGKDKESAIRVSLEREILGLKSQISSLEQNGVDALNVHGEVKRLNAFVAGGKKEIDKLRELIDTEKRYADVERKKAEASKEEAAQALKTLKTERSKASDLKKKLHKIEVEKANECRQQMEILKEESKGAKLKLATETSKLMGVRKELGAEKQKTVKEKERADSEMSKVEALMIQAETNRKEAEKEKSKAENLLQQLERKDCKIEELQKLVKELQSSRNKGEVHVRQLIKKTDNKKVSTRHEIDIDLAILKEKPVDYDMMKSEELKSHAEICRRKAIEEKCRADQLSSELEENNRKVGELQKKLRKFKSSRNSVDAPVVSFGHAMSSDRAEMKLLKKKLKFEKVRLNHAREVAKLERNHRSIIKQELDCVKMEFVQLSNHLDTLQTFASTGLRDTDDLGKAKNAENSRSLCLRKNLHATGPFHTWISDSFRRTPQQIAPLIPLSGGNFTTSVSGTESRLESLPGDSDRKMLQSCAINSSTASFSDGQLVGSQEKAGLSLVTAAKLVEENLNMHSKRSNLPGEISKMKSNENLAMVAENSVKTPIKDHVGKVNEKHQKRKRTLETVESIEYLYHESKKMNSQIEEHLSLLHALNRRTEKPLKKSEHILSNVHEDSRADHKKFQKKRRTLCQKKLETQHETRLNKVDTKVCGPAIVGSQPSQPVSNLTDSCQPCLEELNDSVLSELQTLETFGNIADGDYMRLLNLDSAADEQCYRRAIEMPLSPTLPDICVSGAEVTKLDDFEPLADELHKRLLDDDEDHLQCHSFDVIDAEIKSNYIQCCNSCLLGDTAIHSSKGQFDPFLMQGSYRSDFCDIVQAEKNCLHKVGDFVAGVPTTNVRSSGLEGAHFLSELKSGDDCISCFCVLFSNTEDCYSISRIFSATRACMERCSLITQKEWMVKEILVAVKMDHELLPKEKTCVFFSLLLLNFTVVAFHKYGNFLNCKSCLDSFSGHISEAMLEVETRSLFIELLSLDELLILIEDFIIDARILSCTDASLETSTEFDATVNITLDGINRTLSFGPASMYHLVGASSILASICKAVDCTGFLCEVSYNILRIRRYESSLMLMMLHSFAHIGGDQFFSLDGYSTVMAVLKCIVMHLEGVGLSDDVSFTRSKSNSRTEFVQCANCPFSVEVQSISTVASFLLGLIQNNISKEIMDGDLIRSTNLLNLRALFKRHNAHPISCKKSSCEEIHTALCINYDAFRFLNKYKASDDQLGSAFNATICDVSDAVSLVELLACYMSWNWTCVNIVPQLLKILESSAGGSFTLAIVILLGQLGRFGVDAGGFEDGGVKNLRSSLSAFLCLDNTIKFGLSVQISIVSALLGFISFDFETIIQDKVIYPAFSSQHFQVNLIKKWYSLLSPKQKELSLNIFTS